MAGILRHTPTGKTLTQAQDGRVIARTAGISSNAGTIVGGVTLSMTVVQPVVPVPGPFIVLCGTFVGPSIGGVDYSIDNGNTWSPVLYFTGSFGLWAGVGPPTPFAGLLGIIVRNRDNIAVRATTGVFTVGPTATGGQRSAVPDSLSVFTPTLVQQGAVICLAGTYTGTPPSAIDLSTDFGNTWTSVPGVASGGGGWTGGGPIAYTTTPFTLSVRRTGSTATPAESGVIQVAPAPAGIAESIAVNTPSSVAQSSPIPLTGSYISGPPLALDASLDGLVWTPIQGYTFSGGFWSGTGPAATTSGIGAVMRVRDHNNHSIIANTQPFTVTPVSASLPGVVINPAATNARFRSQSLHGVVLDQPNLSSPSLSATYEQEFAWHTSAIGSAPSYMGAFVDHSLDWSGWVGDATSTAQAWKASTTANTTIPVLGVPLASDGDWAAQTAAFQRVSSGSYDAVYSGIAAAWRDAGFTTLYVRIGYEHNGGNYPWFMGANAPQVSAWVAAFQRVSILMRSVTGMQVRALWNPVSIASTAQDVTTSYPGDAYVDDISLSTYSPLYPLDLYDWGVDNWSVDASLATWAANPVNREHFWNYPSADGYNRTGRTYSGWGMVQHLNFAAGRSKPVSIEAGVGATLTSSNTPTLSQPIFDDGDFPNWLGRQLFGGGTPPVDFVIAYDANRPDGDWRFTDATVPTALTKPQTKAAWAAFFQGHSSIGGSVDLSWGAPTAVAGPFTYQVQYRVSGSSTWSAYGTAITGLSTTVFGLAPGSTYDFQISASNAAGQGPWASVLGIPVPTH